MSIKRSFTVKVTFKEGYGDPITLTGADAEAFYKAWTLKLKGQDGAIGFEWPVVSGAETTWTSFLFCNVAKVERSKQTETQYTDDQCKDA